MSIESPAPPKNFGNDNDPTRNSIIQTSEKKGKTEKNISRRTWMKIVGTGAAALAIGGGAAFGIGRATAGHDSEVPTKPRATATASQYPEATPSTSSSYLESNDPALRAKLDALDVNEAAYQPANDRLDLLLATGTVSKDFALSPDIMARAKAGDPDAQRLAYEHGMSILRQGMLNKLRKQDDKPLALIAGRSGAAMASLATGTMENSNPDPAALPSLVNDVVQQGTQTHLGKNADPDMFFIDGVTKIVPPTVYGYGGESTAQTYALRLQFNAKGVCVVANSIDITTVPGHAESNIPWQELDVEQS